MPSPRERIYEIDKILSQNVTVEWRERRDLVIEKRHLLAYMEGLKAILKENPYLDARVGCGYQEFQDFAGGRQFYVDKTHFITEWMKSMAKAVLVSASRDM